MPGNKYNDNSQVLNTRLGRILRERELRRSSRVPSLVDGTDGNRGIERSDRDFSGFSYVEQGLEGASQAPNEGWERHNGRPVRQRLLVVANRLPVSAVRKGEDSWSLEISAGGLVSALLGVKEFEARWIGWAGVNVPDEVGQNALSKALAEKRCIPVFLDEEIVHQYYNGYCNNILWPLFHYLGLPQEDRLATTRSFQTQFAAYKKANQLFADVVNEHYEEGDVVWCHDYHLMFLPKYLKEYNSKMKVGWFLHTPFPSSEIHRTLPSRSELLRAVLAADLVGFHTYDYARHFVSAFRELFNEYSVGSTSLDQDSDQPISSSLPSTSNGTRDKLKGFDKFLYETSQSQSMESDLEKYLEEPVFPRNYDFNILNWWKVHTPRYPILSMMARDVLGIPVSTLGQESAFSVTGRVLDLDRSSLSPDTREALICGHDWLRMEPEATSLTGLNSPLPLTVVAS